MKISNLHKIVIAALGLTAGAGGLAYGNILSNPDLDDVAIGPQTLATPVGWEIDAVQALDGVFYDGASSETWCNIQQAGGYGLFFKPFQGDASIDNELSVEFYQDNPGVPGAKYTLSGYASAEANYSGWFNTNTPPPATLFVVQFLDGSSTVLASNAFDLTANGLPVGGGGAMALLSSAQYTAPANTVTVRAGVSMLNTYNTSGAQSFFVDAMDLEVEYPPSAPVITNQPANTTVGLGDTAVFTVGVSNTAGVTYQWQSNNVDIVDGGKFSGATTATLTISNVSSNEVGGYRVKVSNSTATVPSNEAALAIVGIHFYPAVEITGQIGDIYRVDYATQLAPSTWIPLSTNELVTSPQLVVDQSAPGNNTRFYRAIRVQ